MHEVSVAIGILDRALDVADDHGAQRIDSVTIEIGRATHVNPDQVRFCLEALAEDTPAVGATIRTETIEPVAACDCGWRDSPEELDQPGGYAPDLQCPACGTRTALVRGRECRLASIVVPQTTPESTNGDANRDHSTVETS